MAARSDAARRGQLCAALTVLGLALPARAAPDVHGQLEPPALAAAPERPRHLGRATLETAGLLLGGTIWYWRALDFNSRDWDLHWDLASWRSKLSGDAIRFDQNLFQTNAVSHSRAGFAHYTVARGNGLGLPASFGVTLATSWLWENVVEFREQPGLNDMIVNTVAGVAIGEPFYQLGEFFLRSQPTPLWRGLAAALSPAASFNDWVDDRRRPPDATDAWGLSRAPAHRFELSAAYHQRRFDAVATRGELVLGLGTDLVTVPRYARPGRFAGATAPGAFTSVNGQLDVGDAGVSGGWLLTRTSLLGRYAQDFARAPGGAVSGYGWLIGLGSAFEYEDAARPGGADFLAVMNVIGPIAELFVRRDGLSLRARAELYGDFAMVKALAYEGLMPAMTGDVFRPGEHGGRIPGVVGARGYYYALGLSAGSRVELGYRGWDLGLGVRADHFDSIAGFDRFREEMTSEIDLVDRRVIARAWLGAQPWGHPPRLSLVLEGRGRRGVAEALARTHLDLRVGLAASIVF